jgi:hypothetical protein
VKLKRKCAAAVAVVVVVMALGTVASASAAPATLNPLSQTNGVISASWTFAQDGSQAWDLEVATSPARDQFGYFVDYLVSGSVTAGATSFTGPSALPPGTYWVYVITTTTLATCELNVDDPLCILDFSNVQSVTIPAPPPPPPPLPPSRPPPPLAPLSSADPVVAPGDVIVARSQDVDKLSITISPGENVKATLSGSVRVPGASKVFRFKPVTMSVAAGLKTTKLALKLSGKAKKAVKKALKRKKALKAKLTLLLTDAAGNKKTLKYTVRLKP